MGIGSLHVTVVCLHLRPLTTVHVSMIVGSWEQRATFAISLLVLTEVAIAFGTCMAMDVPMETTTGALQWQKFFPDIANTLGSLSIQHFQGGEARTGES